MIGLYWSASYPNHWLAALENGTWVQFPAEVNGWAKRQSVGYVDPLTLRRVAGSRAFNTGFPATSETADEVRDFSGGVLDDVA
jgi:hypothetical protein